jgi:hypothetical protein
MTALAAAIVALSFAEASVAQAPQGLWDARGQPAPEGNAFGLRVQGHVAVAAGEITDGTFANTDWFVRAHNATTGATLWEDRWDGSGDWDRTQDMTVDAGRAFASGWSLDLTTSRLFDFVIRAHGVQDGTLLWHQVVDRGAPFEFAEVVGARSGRVFAAGRLGGDPSGGDFGDFALLAFDAQTGELLWESISNPTGLPRVDVAFAISEQGSRVFAAGGGFGNNYVLVQAHDAKSGAVLWQNTIPGAFDALLKWSLNASHGLVFASGDIETAPNDFDAFVHAYDQITGELVWSDRVIDPTTDSTNYTVTAAGDRLLASRVECDDVFSPTDCAWFVRSYDLRTGALQWERRLAFGVLMGPINDAAADAGVAIFGGTDASFGTWIVAALDASTGELLWHDSVDRGGVFGLDVRGDWVFAAGNLRRSDGGTDFSVRAYTLR